MSLDERFFQLHGHYPDEPRTPAPRTPAPMINAARMNALLDGRIAELRRVHTWLAQAVPDAPNCQVVKTTIRTLEWVKAALAVLGECPPPLTPEQHRRAEDAYNTLEAERYYRLHVEPETD